MVRRKLEQVSGSVETDRGVLGRVLTMVPCWWMPQPGSVVWPRQPSRVVRRARCIGRENEGALWFGPLRLGRFSAGHELRLKTSCGTGASDPVTRPGPTSS